VVVLLGAFLVVLLLVLLFVFLALVAVLLVFFVFLVPLAAAGGVRVWVQGGLLQLYLPLGPSESPGCAGMQQQAGTGTRGRRAGSKPRQPDSLLACG
jgi:hypothetical protein